MYSASSFSCVSPSRVSRDCQVSELPLVKCLLCKVDSTVVERTCKKQENFNRKFYRCLTGQYTSAQCKFFMWQGDYDVWLVKEGVLHAWTYCHAHRIQVEVPDSVNVSMKGVNDGVEKMRCELKEAISRIWVAGIAFVTALVVFVAMNLVIDTKDMSYY
uniref:GRF-type domain-containing protein n=1 Tax=Oryza punctata TaxID=4537 RepID=A0A0E0K4A8_ORYPU